MGAREERDEGRPETRGGRGDRFDKLHMLAWISPAHCHKVSYLELLAALTQISSESFTTWVGDNGRLQHRPDKRQHGVLPELFDVDRVAGP